MVKAAFDRACSARKVPPTVSAPAVAALPIAPAVKPYAMNFGDLEFSDVELFADDGSMQGVPRTFIDPCYLIRGGVQHLLKYGYLEISTHSHK